MSDQEAIILMETSKNIEEWNLNREVVKRKIPYTNENRLVHVLITIDTSGLISQVIKPSKLTKVYYV